VIAFYRGGWCPYCNLELRALQQALASIQGTGATLVAISPETPDNSLTTQEKNELEFQVLSDRDNQVAREFGLVFRLPASLLPIYEDFGIDLIAHNGNNHFELPIPATYVVRQDGTVKYAFANVDYTKRAEPSEIVNALQA
jgi:peroxiredoxin